MVLKEFFSNEPSGQSRAISIFSFLKLRRILKNNNLFSRFVLSFSYTFLATKQNAAYTVHKFHESKSNEKSVDHQLNFLDSALRGIPNNVEMGKGK